ncbi:MAG: polysaccharide biosynthesis protein, partial [Leptospiraceae bacterium]|nr:polysaccharide biosynthesis protein [Leptospiraceae bacterium]
DARIEVTGVRPGEKIHEEMITETDALSTLELRDYFVILPSFTPNWSIEEFKKTFNARSCPAGFRYDSGSNTDWLAVDQIRDLIKQHLDPEFVAE